MKKYGYDPRTLGWLKGRQRLRFRVLSGIGDMYFRSLLDVGCGFGDLNDYLRSQRFHVQYLGIDINPKLIEMGRVVHPGVHLEVKELDEVEESFDWVFSSGMFNHRMTDTQRFIVDSLEKMFSLCLKGVAVNFQSSYVPARNPEGFYSPPERIFDICKERLSKRVTLRHDYMPYEFTVYIYKDDQINERNVFSGWKK